MAATIMTNPYIEAQSPHCLGTWSLRDKSSIVDRPGKVSRRATSVPQALGDVLSRGGGVRLLMIILHDMMHQNPIRNYGSIALLGIMAVLHFPKQTWNLKRSPLQTTVLFQGHLFKFHVGGSVLRRAGSLPSTRGPFQNLSLGKPSGGLEDCLWGPSMAASCGYPGHPKAQRPWFCNSTLWKTSMEPEGSPMKKDSNPSKASAEVPC